MNHSEYYHNERLEREEMLENQYARQLLIKHNIKEVTTQRQAINGTRMFEFPVVAHREWANDKNLTLAVYKSGMVRKTNGTSSPYQLNPQYKQKKRWVYIADTNKDGSINDSNILTVEEYEGTARALITNGLARLVYMFNYYKNNYAI